MPKLKDIAKVKENSIFTTQFSTIWEQELDTVGSATLLSLATTFYCLNVTDHGVENAAEVLRAIYDKLVQRSYMLPLIDAMKKGDLAQAICSLQELEEAKNDDELSKVIKAIKNNLVKRKQEIDFRDEHISKMLKKSKYFNFRNEMVTALMNRDNAKVQQCIQQYDGQKDIDFEFNYRGKNTFTPLIYAINIGHAGITRTLLQAGASLSSKDGDGITACFWAFYKGNIAIIQQVLESKQLDKTLANTTAQGQSLLHQAIDGNGTQVRSGAALWGAKRPEFVAELAQIVQSLLSKGADPNNGEPSTGWTPLMLASKYFYLTPVAKVLLNYPDTNINAARVDGWTALHVAAYNCAVSFDIIKLLLEHGANPTLKNKEGKTPRQMLESGEVHDPSNCFATVNIETSKLIAMYDEMVARYASQPTATRVLKALTKKSPEDANTHPDNTHPDKGDAKSSNSTEAKSSNSTNVASSLPLPKLELPSNRTAPLVSVVESINTDGPPPLEDSTNSTDGPPSLEDSANSTDGPPPLEGPTEPTVGGPEVARLTM